MAWTTDPTLSSAIKIKKRHFDEIISRLNTERTKRSYSSISLTLIAEQTKNLPIHVTQIREWIDGTPLTVGCDSHNSTVLTANYSAEKSHNGSYYSTMNYSGTCSSKDNSFNNYDCGST